MKLNLNNHNTKTLWTVETNFINYIVCSTHQKTRKKTQCIEIKLQNV